MNEKEKSIRMNEIRKEIAWISSEYTRMFPTDPQDLDMIADNDRLHCLTLSHLLHFLKREIKQQGYSIDMIDKIIISKLQTKLINCSSKKDMDLNEQEKRAFNEYFNVKVD